MDGVATVVDMPEPHLSDESAQPHDEPQYIEPPSDEPTTADAEAIAPGEATGVSPVQIVEAILFASDGPLPAAKIAQAVGGATARQVRVIVEALNQRYEQTAAAVRVQEIAGGYQLRTLPEYHTYLARLHKARQETKLSAAAMETLSIVAYKQPVTRADVEAVRGVSAGDILNRLREMDLVRIVGRAEDLGRPMLYGTTKRFLEVFGLPSVDDLPKMETPTLSPPPMLHVKGAGIDRPLDMPLPPPPPEPQDAPDEAAD